MKIDFLSPTLLLGDKQLTISTSFSANSGVLTCLSGPSGCGKTSLLRALLGFVEVIDGSILADGKPLSEDNIWLLRRNTAYVPQELNPPVEWVADMMRLPFSLHANRHLKFEEKEIFNIWNELGLSTDLSSLRVRELSGGQRSRIALASAIAMHKPILLADEPTAALDDESSQRVSNTLTTHCQQSNTLTIVVSHTPSIWHTTNQIQLSQ